MQHKKVLIGIGHRLEPVVTVTHGVQANVVSEINRALDDHELIKVKLQHPRSPSTPPVVGSNVQ